MGWLDQLQGVISKNDARTQNPFADQMGQVMPQQAPVAPVAEPMAGQQFAGYQSPFQRKVYTLTPGDLKGPNFQRLLESAESDQDLSTLKRKLESMGVGTNMPMFEGIK